MYKRMRDLRQDHDMLQRDVAKYLGVTQNGYGKYEIGARDVPCRVIIKLAELYNTSMDYIVGLTDVKEPYKRKTKK